MSALDALRAARTRYDVAALLGYKPSALSFIVYRIPVTAKHTTFEIKKIELRGGINNLLDRDPPLLDNTIVGGGSPNTYSTYDMLGREVFMAFTVKF